MAKCMALLSFDSLKTVVVVAVVAAVAMLKTMKTDVVVVALAIMNLLGKIIVAHAAYFLKLQ